MKRITYLFVLLAVSLGYSQNLLTNGDFETGDGTSWGGNALNVVDDGSGSNFITQAEVLAAGNPWDANVAQAVTLADGETYTFSFVAYTSAGATRSMVAGIGEAGDNFDAVTEMPALTETPTTFTYQLTVNYNDFANSRVLFDMGGEAGFVFIDNVSLTLVGAPAPTCTDGIMNGDETGVDCGGSCPDACPPAANLLTNGDFETGDGTGWGGNALNVVDDGSGSNFITQAEVLAAGNPWDANVAQAVTLADGETYTFSFVAYTSAGATRSMVAGIGEAGDNFDAVTEMPALTETPTTFTYQLTVNYNDFANSRVLFDMGGEAGFVFIDNVSLTLVGAPAPTCTDGIMNGDETGVDCGGSCPDACPPAANLLTNGDFETGDGTGWGGNALNVVDDGSGSNFITQAEVLAAGNPWDANVAQAVTLADGETYTFSFVAYTSAGATRSMVAGIGEAGDNFDAVTEMPALTETPTTFTYQLTVNYNDFANSRVLFDMGGEAGFVFIDNVSLEVAGPPAPVKELIEDFEAPAPTVTESNGLGSFDIIADPTASGKGNVLEVVSAQAGEPWQQANLILQDNLIDLSSDATVSVDIYSDTPINILSRVDETEAGDAAFSTAEAMHSGDGTWQTLIFNFAENPDGGAPAGSVEYAKIAFFPMWAGSNSGNNGDNPNWNNSVDGNTFLVDEIWAVKGSAVGQPAETCNDGIQNQDETGIDCGGVCAPCPDPNVLPTTAPPTPPARAAADVISIYGTAYGPAVGLNNVPWDEGSEFVEETIASNEVLKIDFVNFLGTDLGAVTDASDMTYFHMDFWVADAFVAGQVFNVKWSNHNPGDGAGETDAGDLSIPLPGDESLNQTWVSIDVPLTDFANAKGDGIADRAFLTQLLITTAGLVDLGYVDNIYLHKNTTLSSNKFDFLALEAYPNPTNGKWQINTNKEKIESVEVFNILGKSVLSMRPNTASITIDGSSLPSGIYLAKIASKTKAQTLKLVRK